MKPMPNAEILPIYCYLNKKNIEAGRVWKNPDCSFGVEFYKDKIPAYLLPVSLYGMDGNLEPTSEMVAFWLAERVEPPTRQNISDILQCCGLKEYDFWEIIKCKNGNVGTDPVYIGKKWEPTKLRKQVKGKYLQF